MSNSHTLLTKHNGEIHENHGVQYAEQAVQAAGIVMEDPDDPSAAVSGVAIQYVEQPHQDEPDVEFLIGHTISGFYPEDGDVVPFDESYENWVSA